MLDGKKEIVVLDYGMGNVGSILNMLRYIGANTSVATDPDQLGGVRGVILPGVGHFDRAMENLNRSGMADALKQVVSASNLPVLGICLGMQLMCKSSEEGSSPGLGFVDAHVSRFDFPVEYRLKIPHMGWNRVSVQRSGTALGEVTDTLSKFYFVHSFYVTCEDPNDIIGLTHYGLDFVSAFQHGSVTGVQFHPEKSHKYGMSLFRNFVESLP